MGSVPLDVEMQAARQSFLATGSCMVAHDVVRREVLASWERSRDLGVDPELLAPRFLGHHQDGPPVAAAAGDVFDDFLAGDKEVGCSFALLDRSGVVRTRRDSDPTLGRLLDGVLFVPGHGWSEQAVGTTAATVALHEQEDATVVGAEHFHGQLSWLAEAAARVIDPRDGSVAGVVVAVAHVADRSSLLRPVATMLARQVTERIAGEPRRRAATLLDRFRTCAAEYPWVLATDGDVVLTSTGARRLDGADLRGLGDAVVSGLVLQEFATSHADLPSGACAQITLEPVHLAGELIGCVLTGGPARRSTVASEAARRQGSHVAPVGHRDYSADLRASRDGAGHAEARIRANRELLTPFLLARREVAASISQGRNHLLMGEPGVGKRSVVLEQFRRAQPQGRVVTVDCGGFSPASRDPIAPLLDGRGARSHLLLLTGLEGLSPVAARRLDESLRQLVARPSPPLVVGFIDTPAMDATRPYGLLLRHFHETIRVPALRYRVDEIGDIAWAVLRRISARRSLRLSLQVVRVLEGYAWPGNISELEDVLRYVVARKPLGEIRPPDLPALCFQGRARRMSMLESAQCDAIIQALYESRGNRYKAAAMLGIARSSLYRKIDAFGISYIA
ncbi:MAG: sigma54 specific transcriptional regulator, Fis family [Pseudonocardia sp.]|nr:sigma54 specific transcriptional regulator, Fis family [Pseudonocardia sp.]